MKPPILSEPNIEARADEVLREYELRTCKPVGLPVPIEKIAHKVLDLSVEWDSLPLLGGGRPVVSKLRQPRFGIPASIVLNLDLIDSTFRQCPGLEQTAIGHEVGHGVLHLERGRLHQLDLGFEASSDFVSDATSLEDGLVRPSHSAGRLEMTGGASGRLTRSCGTY